MPHVLPDEKRLSVLAQLVNGSGARRASNVTGVHRDTIGRFLERVGQGCQRIHDRMVRNLNAPFVDIRIDRVGFDCTPVHVWYRTASHRSARCGSLARSLRRLRSSPPGRRGRVDPAIGRG